MTGHNPSLRYEKVSERDGQDGRKLRAYRVLRDGESIGAVFQTQRRWSRMGHHGRIRIRDYYPIRWSATRDVSRVTDGRLWGYYDSETYEQDRREWATEKLMELVDAT